MGERRVGDPMLPCPDCLAHSRRTTRIGLRRNECATCNSFAQHIRQRVYTRLRRLYPDEYRRLVLEEEAEHYPAVIAKWSIEHPDVEALIAQEGRQGRRAQDQVIAELHDLANLLGVPFEGTPDLGGPHMRRPLRYAVIPTRDRPEHYERAVRAIRSQVDHLITVAHLGAPYALGRVIRYDEDPPNISTMWRLGLERAALLADGAPRLVALINDDARVSPQWFDRVEAAMDREGTALGGGIRWRDATKVAGYAFIVRGDTVMPSTSEEHRWLYSDDFMASEARYHGGVSIVPEAKVVHGHKRGAVGAEGVI